MFTRSKKKQNPKTIFEQNASATKKSKTKKQLFQIITVYYTDENELLCITGSEGGKRK